MSRKSKGEKSGVGNIKKADINLKNTLLNRTATIKITNALGELNNEVVFVGAAMVSLYIDDPAAEDIRPTKDIDLTFQITTVGKLEQLRASLT